MKKCLNELCLVLLVILLISGNADVRADEPSDYEAVKKSIEQSIGWAIEKDFEAMFRLWADNMSHFWLFPDSLIVGLDNFKKYAERWRDPDFRGTRFEFKDLRIVFSRSSDVAWYSCFLDDCGSYKGKETCLKDVFQTGVLEKIPDFPVLKGPYLGQPPPGDKPEVFAPGIVCTERMEDMYGFFKDGSLFFYESSTPDSDWDWISIPVYRTEIINGQWTKPKKADITGRPWIYEYPDAPEGTKIFFAWRKNLDGSGPRTDIDLWKAEKMSEGWAAPERLGPPVNTERFDSWPSLSEKETLYFFSTRNGGFGKADLYRSILQDDKYREVENLGEVINSEFSDHDPFIAPDESYLLWCSDRQGGFGGNDLYVAYKKDDGRWTEPFNLGEKINTPANETRPYVTDDGKYLFFVSDTNGNLDIYWVEARIIEKLKEEFPVLTGPYLGQKPPGKNAERFAPDVITYEVHESPSISQDLTEMVIDSMEEGSKYYKMIDGVWTLQKAPPFDMPPGTCNGIFLSPSGKRVYFLMWQNNDENFYSSEKKDGKWTKPRSLGDEVNSFPTHWQFTTAKNENLYFSSDGRILVSVFDGSSHRKPEPLKLLNDEILQGVTPFIAPDETYLIFSSGYDKRDSDLYISYRLEDKRWTEPKNLGPSINIEGSLDLCPKISPDGKYLFFVSRRPGPDFQIFWAAAGFIEDLKPAESR